MDVGMLVSLCQEHGIDLVHPGYGFLSESAEFCEQLSAAGITFIGPDAETLRRTGDKIKARKVAEQCDVPVLPALAEPVDSFETLKTFAQNVGMPLMIKAVDGGGGRGIRLVHEQKDLESNLRRALNESPSKQVFAEKAAVGGFRHVEVQILGDGLGNVWHFWERECSIQRRFQKVVEIAPSTLPDRRLISAVIDAALRMAKAIKYLSLGTWEFLVSPDSSTFYFMEINPRLQVEHTITEAICGVDLVRMQILTALGSRVVDFGLGSKASSDATTSPPPSKAIQLRITAEDPFQNFSVSIGRIRRVVFPGGNGLRVDSHLRPGVTISADFDSLLAKLIVSAPDWTSVVAKAVRALEDTTIDGVTTNIVLLQNIIRSQDFRATRFDTQWLESQLGNLWPGSQKLSRHANAEAFRMETDAQQSSKKSPQSSSQIISKGDRFDIQLEGDGIPAGYGSTTMSVMTITRNDFPNSLALKLSPEKARGTAACQGRGITVKVSRQSGNQHGFQFGQRPGESAPPDSSLLICPMAGQLVEILAENGDRVSEGEAIAIVRQMKMELEVRAHRSGIVGALFDHEEGDVISAGTVVCSIVPGDREKM